MMDYGVVKRRLSVTNFLVYAVWGSWLPYLNILTNQRFGQSFTGEVYSTLAIGFMLAPLIGGQVADRWFPTQWFLAASHLIGGVLLFFLPEITDQTVFYYTMMAYVIVFYPTLSLTNSICFHHLSNPQEEFGKVRVWGSAGWILVQFLLYPWLVWVAQRPEDEVPHALRLGGFISILNAGYALMLPHTPPKKSVEKLALLAALAPLRQPSFVAFLLISLVFASGYTIYFTFHGTFFNTLGFSPKAWGVIDGAGTCVELIVMPLVAWMIGRVGFKTTMLLGMLAWALRYLVFATMAKWPAAVSMALHGPAYAFFFTVAYIYVDRQSRPDIRATSQSLLNFVLLGVGWWIGAKYAGWLVGEYTAADGTTDYSKVWLWSAALVGGCMLLLAIAFRNPKQEAPAPATSGEGAAAG